MKRRRFLRTLGAAAAVVGSGPAWRCSSGNPRLKGADPSGRTVDPGGSSHSLSRAMEEPGFQRWTWVHGGGERSPSEWEGRFLQLAARGFTGVLVGGGPAEILSEAAHLAGLEFHRWIWTLNRNGDAWVRENHPEWFTVSRNGDSSLEVPPYVDYYRWLCPTRPAVREYLRDSILTIALDPGVDGIHLDYIRHCDVILPRGLWAKYDLIQDREYPEFDFCYCHACREAFVARTGEDPLELRDPAADPRWRRFRWDSVTELVKVLARAVHGVESPGPDRSVLRPRGPGKPISAAVFPTPSIARRLVRQAWEEWPLDAFFPMLYHEFYLEGLDWIGRGVEEGLAALERVTPASGSIPRLFAGLYLPTLNREGDRAKAVQAARTAGAHGVSFFEMNGLELEG